MGRPECWLRVFDTRTRLCDGPMDRAHLVPCQLLRREGLEALIPDERIWVPACRFHHANFDSFRGVRVPRARLPESVEQFCTEHFLLWYLDRRYGARTD